MTRDERETHAAVLRDLVQDAATEARAPEMTDARVFACLAGAAALAPQPTCETCKWFVPWFKDGVTANGYPEKRGDCKHRNYLGRRNGQSPDDGCIKGYAPTEPTR